MSAKEETEQTSTIGAIGPTSSIGSIGSIDETCATGATGSIDETCATCATDNTDLSNFSSNIINIISSINKSKIQTKRALTSFIEYVNKDKFDLNEENKISIKMLINTWNKTEEKNDQNDDKLDEINNFILKIEKYSKDIDPNDFTSNEYLTKLWLIYTKFNEKMIKNMKELSNFYIENKDKIDNYKSNK